MPPRDPAKKKARDERHRQRHIDRVASGVCTRCGRLPPEPGIKVCTGCAEKRRAADRARRAKARSEGKQYGGRDPERCRRADRAGDRRRRRARQEAGLCTSCGLRRPQDNRSVCEPCREARRNSRAPERHLTALWPPQIAVTDLETGEELGVFETESEAAACIAFARLRPNQVEIRSNVPLMALAPS